AGGDRAMNVRQASLSDGSVTRSTQMLSDRNNFRASLGLDAKRNNLTIGVGVNALLSSVESSAQFAAMPWPCP
ncbi:MAG: hypothetical protein J6Z30_02810, partial [Pyramidobacter sp.]|nr:hypothetical protein [Pyramidobacter sp.]